MLTKSLDRNTLWQYELSTELLPEAIAKRSSERHEQLKHASGDQDLVRCT